MESYIEVTWITNFLILLNASTLAFYLAAKPCAFRYVILYSALIPLCACFIFHRYEWCFMLIMEGAFFYKLYRYHWKGWLLMIAHRLLCNLTCYIWYQGSFHLGIYFVGVNQVPYLIWMLLALTWLGMFYHWKLKLSQQNFIYPIEIKGSHVIVKLKGYLDSGNFMLEEGVPILILDRQYEEYFDQQSIQWIEMNTLQGEGRIKCCKAMARIQNAHYHSVWIHFSSKLHLPLGAKALLNLHMMTQE